MRARRTAILALILAMIASLAGFFADRAWSASEARGVFVAAQMRSEAALHHARQVGVSPQQLAPYQARANRIANASEPPLWSPQLDTFYHRQTAVTRRLTRQVAALVRRVTAQTKTEAESSLQALQQTTKQAKTLRLDARSVQRTLETETAALQSGSTPREFRAIATSARTARARLARTVASREKEVRALLAAAHGSRKAVIRQAKSDVAATHLQLAILHMLNHHYHLGQAEVQRTLSMAEHQRGVFAAAVVALQLRHELAGVRTDFKRTVPAKLILVSTERQWVYLYQDGKQIYDSPATTGGPELPTDHGVFHIYMKVTPWVFHSPWPPGSPYYYPPTPITYWMPFDGGEGLHDAWWRSNFGPGSNREPTNLGDGNVILGTHGCVNIPMAAAAYIWHWAPVGTKVVVI